MEYLVASLQLRPGLSSSEIRTLVQVHRDLSRIKEGVGNPQQQLTQLEQEIAKLWSDLELPSGNDLAVAQKGNSFRASLLKPSSIDETAPGEFKVRLGTSKGDIVIAVTREWSPHGADRFYSLVNHGYYNGASFFRVLSGFVAQFGLSPDAEINRTWSGDRIPDDPVLVSNAKGTIAFAAAGPYTRTTQLFINLVDNPHLDKFFSPFGRITRGMEVVNSLYSGYGEGIPSGRGPDQSLILERGDAYLRKQFPMLDYIYTAAVVDTATE